MPSSGVACADHAREKGLIFLSLGLLGRRRRSAAQRLGMPAWKVGSGEVALARSSERHDRRRRARPAQHRHERAGRRSTRRSRGCAAAARRFALFQCTSRYPIAAGGCRPQRDRRIAPALSAVRSACRTTPAASYPGARRHRARRRHHRGAHHVRPRACSGPTCRPRSPSRNCKLVIAASATPRDAWTRIRSTRTRWRDELADMRRDVRQEPGADAAASRRARCWPPDMLTAKKPGGGNSTGHAGHRSSGAALRRDVTPDRLLRWDDLDAGMADAKNLRRRQQPRQLRPHQDRAAARSSDHPELELQLIVGASALLHRFGNVHRRHPDGRLRARPRSCIRSSRARRRPPWRSRPGSASSSSPRSSRTSSRTWC